MAAGDINSWRKQNSDQTMIEVMLSDGTVIRGSMMQPRDKTVRETISQPDPFLDLECDDGSTILIAKAQLRYVKPIEMPKSDHLERRLKMLEKMDVYAILRLQRGCDPGTVEASAERLMNLYDPERTTGRGLPSEVVEYMRAMSRRVETARAELISLLEAEAAAAVRIAARAAADQQAAGGRVPVRRPAA
jgi:hypothetical protein